MHTNTPTYSKIWNVTWPIMLSLIAQNVVSVTDTAFLGHVGSIELGAAAIGGIFYITLFMVAYGFTTGVQILIARRFGEKNYGVIGSIFDNSFYFLGISTLLISLFIVFLAPQFLKPLIQSTAVFNASIEFLNYRIFGLFFASAILLFRSFYTGITFTKYISLSAAIMAVANVILDYGLIFGKLGLPEMGIAGAGLASSISEFLAFLYFLFITLSKGSLKKYNLLRFSKPDFKIIGSIFNVSGYIVIQFVLSHGVWFAFFLVIEKMGETSLAVGNIIRSVYMLLMIPAWALSSTTNTLVSNLIGEGHHENVIPLVKKIMGFALAMLLVIAAIAAFIPNTILSIYTNDPLLIEASFASFYIILGAEILFSITIIQFNGVLGTGNTRTGLALEVVTLLIYVFSAWLLAIKLRQPIEIVWFCEYVYSIILGGISWMYLLYGNWRSRKI